MKKCIGIILVVMSLVACGTSNKSFKNEEIKEKPVRIANDSLEYEIIIIDIGFNRFLNTQAQVRGFHNQYWLENRNVFKVQTYNQRVNRPDIFGDLYPQQIDYDPKINYGYEVNYLLFNYFLFFEQKYNQRL